MAHQGPKESYILIDKANQVSQAISAIWDSIRNNRQIALDCEGVNLGRDGELTMVQIGLPQSPAYLFDIKLVGRGPFDDGLKEILEDSKIQKLMYDCKSDSDALRHQYEINLKGVIDLQLYEIYGRQFLPDEEKPKNLKNRWVAGYATSIEIYLKDEELLQRKTEGADVLHDKTDIWGERPISPNLLDYAAVDVNGLFRLYEHFQLKLPFINKTKMVIEEASNNYVKLHADKTTTNETFERHNLLPWYVIPGMPGEKTGKRDTSCIGCLRLFPREIFSPFHLKKNTQKCPVCIEAEKFYQKRQNFKERDERRQKLLEESIVVNKEDDVGKAVDQISKHRRIAIKCDGKNIGREGELKYIQIATHGRHGNVYFFDIEALGKIDERLKGIMENEDIIKLMFDCKNDCDILHHKHNVYLRGILDLQLFQIKYREVCPPTNEQSQRQKQQQRRQGASSGQPELPNVTGYAVCFKQYLSDDDAGLNMNMKDLFRLYNHFTEKVSCDEILEASKRYAMIFRDKPERTFDCYENNRFLPLNILSHKEGGMTECLRCLRKLHPEHFCHKTISWRYEMLCVREKIPRRET